MIAKTDRLHLEKLSLEDAPFIFKLVNQQEWIRFIGDRNVKDLSDAEHYITSGPHKSFESFGYSLFKVSLKVSGEPIGMCGLLKRDYLDHPDIGFAFLSEFTGKGYALEAAQATLQWAAGTLDIQTVLAITMNENEKSINLLERLGMHFERMVKHLPDEPEVRLYST